MRHLPTAVTCLVFSTTAHASIFAKSYKVLCPNSPEGCGCYAEPGGQGEPLAKPSHYLPVGAISGTDEVTNGQNEWIRVKVGEVECYMPRKQLRPMTYESEVCPDPNAALKLPWYSPSQFLRTGDVQSRKIPLGKIFPTFYNIADESFHVGPKTETLYEVDTERELAVVSKSFRDSLDLEGTGRLNSGVILNVGERVEGVWRYVVLPKGSFGLGIHNQYLYPMQAAAVDFDYLCEKANLPGCTTDSAKNRKLHAGALLYIKQLDGLKLPNGATHNGFICAQDIGGAIKQDRIDLFVGPLGGGNPYEPACRRMNPYNTAGIESIAPYDWKNWKENGVDPKTGNMTYARVDPYEYRTSSPQKGLDVFLVEGSYCKGLWNAGISTANNPGRPQVLLQRSKKRPKR